MWVKLWRRSFIVALMASLLAVTGCDQAGKTNPGVYVMFDGRPNLYDHQVYYNSRPVGEIMATDIKGSTITRLTIAIFSEYKNQVDDRWAFYADRGRLLAVRLNGGGAPLHNGDKLCGFNTKAAYHWFKFKTLLSDRAYKAGKRADNLFKRFDLS